MQDIILQIKNGKNFLFSYTDRTAESHFSIEISYLTDKNLFNVFTTEQPAFSEKISYNESLDEAALNTYLTLRQDKL